MEQFGRLIGYIMDLFQYEVVIYGHTVSMWQIYIFTIVASMVLAFIGGIFNGD